MTTLRWQQALTAIRQEGRRDDIGSGAGFLIAADARWKVLLQDALGAIHSDLLADHQGRKAASRIATMVDAVVECLFESAMRKQTMSGSPDAECLCIAAVGGFGRRSMAPFSDVDLLFLCPDRVCTRNQEIIEHVLYGLWNLNFRVGHAVRTLDECLAIARSDLTVRTAILEARFLAGDARRLQALWPRLDAEIIRNSAPEYIEYKLAEREMRHLRAGRSRYQVEPNIKEGKGGLRDVQTLYWLARYVYGWQRFSMLVRIGVLSREEMQCMHRVEDFLWCVRCLMHFRAERAEDVLSFQMQPEIASDLRFCDCATATGVERFMKAYFLVAREVGFLTRAFCAALESQALKPVPVQNRQIAWRPVSAHRTRGFVIEGNRINFADRERFLSDACNVLRVFELAIDSGLFLHPEVLHAVTRNLDCVDSSLRESREANAIFLAILCHKNDPEPVLRTMNETGLLGRFIPDFDAVVAMMQFNLYHRYTVDEHLLRTVGMLAAIESGEHVDAHPVASQLVRKTPFRSALYVAALFHDIGKGRGGNHARAGAAIVARYALRFGLAPTMVAMAAWLVENHLLMSDTAQRRDLDDAGTIQIFLRSIPSQEHLDALLILTVIDIQAVGPGVWNGWKGELLRKLYVLASSVLSQDAKAPTGRPALTEEGRATSPHAGPADWVRAVVRRGEGPGEVPFAASQFSELIATQRKSPGTLSWRAQTDEFRSILGMFLAARSKVPLLLSVAAACAHHGANIVEARFFREGTDLELGRVLISRTASEDRDEKRKAARLAQTIHRFLESNCVIGQARAKERVRTAGLASAAIPCDPTVTVDNSASQTHTLLATCGRDRSGLLYELIRVILDQDVEIVSAHIDTVGERAYDTFYLTGQEGQKLMDPLVVARLKTSIEATLSRDRARQGKGGVVSTAFPVFGKGSEMREAPLQRTGETDGE